MSDHKILVIGLDGATWDLMSPWIRDGRLPNLARLVQEGSSGVLASTVHPLTTPAWTSFMSGLNQGKHGVFDHVQRRPDSYGMNIMDSTRIGAPLIFDYLGRQGVRSVSINVPLTYPPTDIEGVMVSGLFGTQVGRSITNSPAVFDRIMEVAPNYVVHPDFQPRAKDPLSRYASDLLQSVEDRFTVAETLLAENSWGFAIVVFTATDQIQHAFWHFMDDEGLEDSPFRSAVFEVYKRIDDNLSRLLRFADENTLVFVMSDHGAGPLHAIVNLNKFLSDQGFLRFADTRATGWRSKVFNTAATLYKTYIPAATRATIRRTMPGQFTRAKEILETELFASAIDWSRTNVYALGACGNIFINLKGREPDGVVNPGPEYERLCGEVAERFLSLRTPSGKRLIKEVLRREQLYHGPYLEQAPDLVLVWEDYGYWGRARYDQNQLELFDTNFAAEFGLLPNSGTHRPEGILIATGPGVASEQTITGAKLIDLVPTALAFLGLSVPRRMDGRVLEELFVSGSLGVTYQDDYEEADLRDDFAYSPEEEALVKKHLEDLGYL